MGYSYKGNIAFGLVYIPIKLQKAVQEKSIGFNMLDRKTMSRVQYKKTCVDCGNREVKQADIIKGYEYQENKYVIFTEDDFEKIKTEKEKNITIETFVDVNEIDPIYYDTPYYVLPQGADKAYALLTTALNDMKKVGIAKTVLGNKETLIALRAQNGGLVLNTLHFYDEVVRIQNTAKVEELNIKEVDMAKMLVDSMAQPFDAREYKDEYHEKLQAAITQKINGQEITSTGENKNTILDLMQALEASINQNIKKPKKTVPTRAKRSKLKKVK